MKFAEIHDKRVTAIVSGDDYTVLPPQSVEITDKDEVNIGDIYVPSTNTFRAPTTAELEAPYRVTFNAERSRLFSETEWVRERHSDHQALDIDDKDNWKAWLDYWQKLRDMPTNPEFNIRKPAWPEKPE